MGCSTCAWGCSQQNLQPSRPPAAPELTTQAWLQVYLHAHVNLWGDSRAWIQAIQALALGNPRAGARVLSLAAGTLPTQHADTSPEAQEEEVFAHHYVELCEVVRPHSSLTGTGAVYPLVSGTQHAGTSPEAQGR